VLEAWSGDHGPEGLRNRREMIGSEGATGGGGRGDDPKERGSDGRLGRAGRPAATVPMSPPPADAGPGVADAPLEVALIPVLRDNYVFVIHNGRQAVVVDPALAEPVRRWLEQRQLELVAVLQTHHHSDHIGGTPELLQRWPQAAVVAARADRDRIPFQTRGVADGERVPLLGRELEVLEVPGHTRAHIAFHLLPAAVADPRTAGDLFCGDTLFAGGCGRLFEGTPQQMWHSLARLAALPGPTRVWCAHEYTENNLHWASRERPDDVAIATRLREVRERRRHGLATIPSRIDQERATNLFVRSGSSEELARLRESRNTW
jgi:hydroxyacylglutathione hydrolase